MIKYKIMQFGVGKSYEKHILVYEQCKESEILKDYVLTKKEKSDG